MKVFLILAMLLSVNLVHASDEIEPAIYEIVVADSGAMVPMLVADSQPVPGVSPSLTEPTNPGEALGFFGPLIEAFKAKNWEVFAALLIMIVVYGLRLMVPTLQAKPQVLAIISASIGVVSSIAMSLYSKTGILSAIISGLFMGAAASGFWSQLFKFVFPSKEESKNA